MNRTGKKVQRSKHPNRRIFTALGSGEFRCLLFVAAAFVYGKFCGRSGTPEWLTYGVVFLLLPLAAAIAVYVFWYFLGFIVVVIAWLLNAISIGLEWMLKTKGKQK